MDVLEKLIKFHHPLLLAMVLFMALPACGGSGGGSDDVVDVVDVGDAGDSGDDEESTTPGSDSSLVIVIPEAGQTLAGNSSEEITWTSEGTVGNLLIELSTDGGTTFSTLVEGTPNDGSELVSLPDTRNESCTIRITEIDGSVTDESGIFTIWSNIVPQVQNVTMSGTSGDIDITYDLTDADGDSCSIDVEYFNGGGWLIATVTGIVTDIAPSTELTLVWNSDTDSVGLDTSSCQIRITPFDTEYGDAGTSETFEIHNISFQAIGAGLTGLYMPSMAWGDYDNDGDLDLAIAGKIYDANADIGITSIYRNNGDNSFTDIEAGLPGIYNGSLAWGDYDNDGDLDLAIAGRLSYNSDITSIFRNDEGIFSKVKSLSHAYLSSLAWGDYDNDGDLDLAFAGHNSVYDGITRICRNDDGSFTEIDPGLPGVKNCCLAWGDYDNDGDLDLAIEGNSGTYSDPVPITKIYRNEDGSFSDIEAGLTGIYYGSLAWGDYDNDGDLDLAVAGNTGSTYITRIYKNDNQTFTPIGAGLTGISSVGWGDYDNDGDLDLAMAGYIGNDSQIARIYRNDDGSFTDIGAGLTGVRGSELAWGDYDNDGDLDLALSGWPAGGYDTLITRIYSNNSAKPNSLPEQPANLLTYIAGDSGDNDVLFMWESGQDEETPSPGLSYQLRIGTAEGGNDVWPGHHLADGQRLLPEMGSIRPIGSSISYKLLSLTTGTYYWTVQTIDSAFEGSSVTNTATVTVP